MLRTDAADRSPSVAHLAWYAAGVALAFLLPYVFTSALEVDGDLYYGIYFAGILLFLTAYVRVMNVDLATIFTRNWRWSLAIGVLASLFLVWNVTVGNDATPRPDGAYFVFTLLWRGLAYGVVDSLILSAFPAVVTYHVLRRDLSGLPRKLIYGGLSLLLVLVIIAVYHLGYEQFREDGVKAPEVGNTVISLPAILTANPLGSLVAHASMHIAADIHAYETDVFLPPQRSAD